MNKTIVTIIMLLSILCSPLIYAEPQDLTRLNAELRDPTRPPPNIQGQAVLAPASFILNAIVTAPNRKIAIINGLAKRIGDEIMGEHVTAINKNTVQLEGPSGKITLFLFGKPIKHAYQIVCKRNWNVCRDIGK